MAKPNLKPAPKASSNPKGGYRTFKAFNKAFLAVIRQKQEPRMELFALAGSAWVSPKLAKKLLNIAYDELGLSESERVLVAPGVTSKRAGSGVKSK